MAGVLRCPSCGGVLAPWGHARRRLVAVAAGWEEFWPRRGRCRGCGRTHVLLPADLWSWRRYGAAVIMAVLVLAAQAAAAGRAAARPWLVVPGGGGQVVAVAVRGAGIGAAGTVGAAAAAGGPGGPGAGPGRVGGRGLPGRAGGGDGRAGPPVPGGGRGVGSEVAAHLSGGLWLAPAVPVLRFSTTLLSTDAVVPS